jgi:hypothetical protein
MQNIFTFNLYQTHALNTRLTNDEAVITTSMNNLDGAVKQIVGFLKEKYQIQ